MKTLMTAGQIVGLAEWIIDDPSCLVIFALASKIYGLCANVLEKYDFRMR